MNVSTPDDQLLDLLKTKSNNENKTVAGIDLSFLDQLDSFKRKVVEKLLSSIESDEEVIAEMADAVKSSYDPEQAAALAALNKSLGDKIKLLTEIMMQVERIQSTEKMKEKEFENKKELVFLKNANATPNAPNTLIQNNTIIADRETALKLAERNKDSILNGTFTMEKARGEKPIDELEAEWSSPQDS